MFGCVSRIVISSTARAKPLLLQLGEATSETWRKLLFHKKIQASPLPTQFRILVRKTTIQLQRTLRSRTLQAIVALCAAAGLPACAAPKEPSDSVARFLRDRGLMNAATPSADQRPGLLGSMRDHASDLVLTAMNFLGVPYRFGGTSEETGFDCSGFTRHVFESSLGLILPRRAEDQAQASGMLNINHDDLKPGDLVFFNTMRRAFSHVGIYVGDGKFIHSPRTGSSVRVEDMRQAYWSARFNGARRIPDVSAGVLSFPGSTNLSSSQTP